MRLLVLKTGALGDVLRSTSILPGLAAAHPDLEVTWITAPAAKPLVAEHPLVKRVLSVSPKDASAVADLGQRLQEEPEWDWILSFDDEEPLCRLASQLATKRLSGAFMQDSGERAYTDDVGEWFGMGLLSRDGKQAADLRKVENTRSHPQIFSDMLGIDMGQPALPLSDEVSARAECFAGDTRLRATGLVIGLNTGAGGRWRTKAMDEAEVVLLTKQMHLALEGRATFLLLGGPDEKERNERLSAAIAGAGIALVHGGTDNSLENFAGKVSLCDLLIVSDSMALHVALARKIPLVAFFAPTSAAEIELYGLGEKVISTAPDYCSYRPDADNSTITADRVGAAVLRVLAERKLGPPVAKGH